MVGVTKRSGARCVCPYPHNSLSGATMNGIGNHRPEPDGHMVFEFTHLAAQDFHLAAQYLQPCRRFEGVKRNGHDAILAY